MTEVLETKDLYLAEFRQASAGPAWLQAIRKDAIARFEALGFPTGREEEWRYTDVTPIAETPFRPARGPVALAPLEGIAHGPLRKNQIAFVDGRYAPQFSALELPPGAVVKSLGAALRDDESRVAAHLGQVASVARHPFAALNTALAQEGALIHVPRGVRVEQPIHLLFMSVATGEPFATHPRILIVLEPGAQAAVVESYLGPAGGVYLTNAVTEIVAEEGAVLDYYKVQRESPLAYHVASIHARQARHSSVASHAISLGAALSRNDLGVVLQGEGAECTLNGLYETNGRQLADNHTVIDHATAHGTSRELYKGVLGGRSRAVFDGRIIVRPAAQKTNAMQTNRNLLLSKESLVQSKPQLEIFANDVKCKHGATIGQLDEDVLFYLRSRGIGFEEARRLLIHAFASEIIDQVKIDAVRAQLGGCMLLMATAGGHA